ncbi:hypothetical protein Tco_0123294 [Tanacetum coccineum]
MIANIRRHHGPWMQMHTLSQPFEFSYRNFLICHGYYTVQSTVSPLRDHLKMEMEMEIPSSSNVKLMTECTDTTYTCYEVMKDLIKVSKLPQTLISYSSSQVHKMAINY